VYQDLGEWDRLRGWLDGRRRVEPVIPRLNGFALNPAPPP
jgi:hypothetical protein